MFDSAFDVKLIKGARKRKLIIPSFRSMSLTKHYVQWPLCGH